MKASSLTLPEDLSRRTTTFAFLLEDVFFYTIEAQLSETAPQQVLNSSLGISFGRPSFIDAGGRSSDAKMRAEGSLGYYLTLCTA